MARGKGVGAGVGEGEGHGVGSGLMRCFLIVVNILFGLIGFVLLAGGIFIKVGESLYMPFVNDIIKSIPSFTSGTGMVGAASPTSQLTASFDLILGGLSTGLIILGLFLFITAIFGCIGGCCQVKVIMIIYCVVLIILLIGQLAMLIMFATGYLDSLIKGQLMDMLKNKFVGIDDFGTESILLNVVMIQFKCCGVLNYQDFSQATVWKKERQFTVTVAGQTVSKTLVLQTPVACCQVQGSFPSITLPDNTCAYAPTPLNNNMNVGCFDALMLMLNSYRTIVIGALAGIVVFQAILVILVIVLLVLKGKEENKVV